MTSRDEMNPSGLPTDSLDNAFQDSPSLDLNSGALFSSSAAGPSGIRSGNNDPINDTVIYENQDLEDENFITPSESLTEANLNSDNPFTDAHFSRESSGQRFISFQDLSNSLPLGESVNDVETSLSESLISKYETFQNDSLQQTPFDETQAYQLKKTPRIISCYTPFEESCWADFDPSTCFGPRINVRGKGREKSDIKMAEKKRKKKERKKSKNLKTACAGNGEDSRSFEQSKFETSENFNISDHPLNSENKSLHKQIDPKQNTILAGAFLPQNIITRNDVSGGGGYLLNASNTVDENDSNLKIRSEFASNETNSDNIKEVGVHLNPLEIKKHHYSNSTSNNNIDTQASHLSKDKLYKYQELKTITNNFFKPCQRSSLHKDQRKETFLEAEAEIKTTNIPSLIRDSSSIDKGAVNNNYNDNPQNNDEPTEETNEHHNEERKWDQLNHSAEDKKAKRTLILAIKVTAEKMTIMQLFQKLVPITTKHTTLITVVKSSY
ncbi:hypothetical protein AVEN_264200-1 [Araneus ventricosus]|uniref:Uncharacterized protein n=1 Tax=Araneus ventricosus TaxID=182803 RepID=A0A4Y2REB5_ARAVE|nr:hypothetical protein AVEN_264200-1 [Araneus ventricosus]